MADTGGPVGTQPVIDSLGRVPREQKMLRVTYPESYITEYTQCTKIVVGGRTCSFKSKEMISLLKWLVGGVYRVSSSLLGPVDPSSRALSGRPKSKVRRHKFNNDPLSGRTLFFKSKERISLFGKKPLRNGTCQLQELSVVVISLEADSRGGGVDVERLLALVLCIITTFQTAHTGLPRLQDDTDVLSPSS